MLNIYKKVEKKIDNLHGIIEIKSINELNKPFLLCLSAQDTFDKSVYGIIREGARAARIHTTMEPAAGYKIDEFPIDFLGVSFIKDEHYQENYEEIVDKLIYPYLFSTNKEVEEIKKQAKKINIMTYCDGTETYKGIEKILEEKLSKDGFTTEEINSIISKIKLVAIGTMTDTSNLKATTTTFIDVNDNEIETEKTDTYKNLLQNKNRKSINGTNGTKNNSIYLYEGTGKHDLKEYLKDGNIVKPALCSIVSFFIEASLNSKLIETPENISKILNKYSNEDIDPSKLLEELDSKLNYNDCPKYTKEEAKLRDELDLTYKELLKTRKKLERTNKEKERLSNYLKSVIENIKQYCSKINFYKILVEAKLWQADEKTNFKDEKSDKEIRALYDTMILNSNQESKKIR